MTWSCVQALLNRGGRGSDCDFGITLSISSSCHFKLLIREFLPGVDFVEGRLLQQLESKGKAGPENEYVCENREKEEEN